MAQAKSSKIFQIFNIGITAVPFGKRSRGPTIKISSAEKLKSVSTVRHRVARQRCSCVPKSDGAARMPSTEAPCLQVLSSEKRWYT